MIFRCYILYRKQYQHQTGETLDLSSLQNVFYRQLPDILENLIRAEVIMKIAIFMRQVIEVYTKINLTKIHHTLNLSWLQCYN